MSAPSTKNFIADLDLLRAFAVLVVVVHRANFNLFSGPRRGWSDSIRILTAALVSICFKSPVSSLPGSGAPPARLSVTDRWLNASLFFWINRPFRILPSAWFWLALILLLSVAFSLTGVFGSFRANFEATIAGILQVANFALPQPGGNFPYGASFCVLVARWRNSSHTLPFVIWFGRRYLVYILAAPSCSSWYKRAFDAGAGCAHRRPDDEYPDSAVVGSGRLSPGGAGVSQGETLGGICLSVA